MKRFLIKYYALIVLILFVIVNVILKSLKMGGLIYQIMITLLIIFNIITLITYRKEIKFKSGCAIVSFLLSFLFFKNIWQFLFSISNTCILIILGTIENKYMRIVTAIMIGLIIGNLKYFFTLIIIIIIYGAVNERGFNDIYEEMHYYCDNNYEAYAYSAGAMDKYHYSIGKYYVIAFKKMKEKTSF